MKTAAPTAADQRDVTREAERAFIGSIIDRPMLVEKARQILGPSERFDDPHVGAIWRALCTKPEACPDELELHLRSNGAEAPPQGWRKLLQDLVADKIVDTADTEWAEARARSLLRLHGGSEKLVVNLASAFLPLDKLLALPRLPRVPILGECGRLFSTGTYGILTGRDGDGKSLEALHLLVAVANGSCWFGIETCGPHAVAYVLTDDDRDVVRDRLAAIALRENALSPDLAERIYVLARPWPWGSSFDLIENASGMIDFLVAHEIRLLVVDHAAAVHSCSPFDFRPLIDAADRIANEAEVGILFVTHPSKARRDDSNGDSAGDSRFGNLARLRMSTRKIGKGYVLSFVKPSRGPTPPAIDLAHVSVDDPSLVVTKGIDPVAAKAGRLGQARQLLAEQPDLTVAELAKTLTVTERTARRYLGELGKTS